MATKTTTKPRRRRSKGKHPWLWLLTFVNVLFLFAVYLSHVYVAESNWWSMFLTYIPQLVFLVPGAVLTLLCMRRKTLRLLVLNTCAVLLGVWFVAGFVWHPFAGPGDKPKLRVMTFNIHGGKQGFGEVARTVDRQKPDVVCFQEAGNIRAGKLPEMLPQYSFRFEGGLAVGSRLPIVAERAFRLPPSQIALSVTVEQGGEKIEIVNTHLSPTNIQHDFRRGEEAVSKSMTRAAASHAREVGALLEGTLTVPGKLVVCGDFNAPPFGIQYGRLTQYLTDVFAASGTGFGYTVPARLPFIRIDHVFCNDRLRPAGAWVPADVSSDHRALVAEVVWR
jgi:endonuclease/exonuclease/phosphatase (EEP) superfamily protein YafD